MLVLLKYKRIYADKYHFFSSWPPTASQMAQFLYIYNFSSGIGERKVLFPGMDHFIPYSYNCGLCHEDNTLDAIIKMEQFQTEFPYVTELLNLTVRHMNR